MTIAAPFPHPDDMHARLTGWHGVVRGHWAGPLAWLPPASCHVRRDLAEEARQ